MKTITVLLSLALVLVCWLMASCAMGPDWSPDVQSAAASFGGPTFAPNGVMMSSGSGGANNRRTMFQP